MVGQHFSFDGRGLTFGRAGSNDLVLPDPQCFVSSRHAMIAYANGEFTAYDQSSNGLYIDRDEKPVGVGNSAALTNGTQLKAGDYRLDLEICESVATELPLNPETIIQLAVPSGERKKSVVAEGDIAAELALRLGLHGMSESKLQSMPDEVITLIRRCISSVMDVLSSRRKVKSQLKLDNTVIKSEQNNPLKVSASADDAIERMFTKSSNVYLSPEQALIEAFQDIGDHQVAMMAATLQVYQQVVDQFEPAEIEKRLPKSKNAGGLFTGKRKLWEEYTEQYDTIAANGAENVHEAFLHEFSAIYSDQLLKLKKERAK